MKKIIYIISLFASLSFVCSCKTKSDAGEDDVAIEQQDVQTPVTITNPAIGNMNETIEINAVSAFLLKSYVKANTTGYLQTVNVYPGAYVTKGQTLFIIKTKEAETLGNTINLIDSSLHFDGTLRVKSPGNGYITQTTYKPGDYVQDGEQLAEITDTKSFVFLLDLPYELKPYLQNNSTVQLRLPDSTTMSGNVGAAMPVMDSASQTLRYIIHVNTNKITPENLIAKVSLIKTAKRNAVSLPKAAVLSDEVQSQFWIMKMINDSTAVKVPVKKGMENKDNVEIVSPPLAVTDKILLTGNYGLPDTAKVKVVSGE
ncbi:MAG TPA: efflux RND transporter periplasmic adaptor subunit [Parafilimonas sp.]|nr:efflux RND transporter periplasmic adaptor subunit [Parafilimonas sp.]